LNICYFFGDKVFDYLSIQKFRILLHVFKDGLASIRQNHEDEGYNNISMSSGKHSKDYLDAYKTGKDEQNDTEAYGVKLPVHTKDNYKSFYIGEHDGAILAEKADSIRDSTGHYNCPITTPSCFVA
jgi:hypothetical protein